MNGDDAHFVARLDSPEATRAFAAHLGAGLAAGDLVLLEGDLGAGKTTFVQGLARGMGLAARVKSPTYTLVHEHRGADSGGGKGPGLGHLDLYRMAAGRDLSDLGLDDLLARGAVAVEWGGRLLAERPEALLVTLRSAAAEAGDGREVELVARRGLRGETLLARAAGWTPAGTA